MIIGLISFTRKGSKLCRQISDGLSQNGNICEAYTIPKYAEDSGLNLLEESLSAWTGRMFSKAQALIYVGACGIAVRSIAPYIVHKTKDPAVIVIDESGNNVISLLSGHMGGANALTKQIAELTGARPVITTATDVNGLFSVDEFAARNNLHISDMNAAKRISADILDVKKVNLYSDFQIVSEVPLEFSECSVNEEGFPDVNMNCLEEEASVYITLRDIKDKKENALILCPKILIIGIGCKRGTDYEDLHQFVFQVLQENDLSIDAVSAVSSIDLKAAEPAILRFSKEYNLPFHTFTAAELSELEGTFTASSFVSQITGVDNVCERSAAAAAGGSGLIVSKRAWNGITAAVARKEWEVNFE